MATSVGTSRYTGVDSSSAARRTRSISRVPCYINVSSNWEVTLALVAAALPCWPPPRSSASSSVLLLGVELELLEEEGEEVRPRRLKSSLTSLDGELVLDELALAPEGALSSWLAKALQ